MTLTAADVQIYSARLTRVHGKPSRWFRAIVTTGGRSLAVGPFTAAPSLPVTELWTVVAKALTQRGIIDA